jgi:hypothetical protein
MPIARGLDARKFGDDDARRMPSAFERHGFVAAGEYSPAVSRNRRQS